eukprot:TRINITY_DN19826_c0_g1_i3.p1 TRINITY_DN19826_c0_g1~~TRINITY_DN19826_c0_g1_i3.p1  ORF type:complete len:378 (-),score=85.20 TRINITY_DN19826_c0_g1_i3:150-1283(-)
MTHMARAAPILLLVAAVTSAPFRSARSEYLQRRHDLVAQDATHHWDASVVLTPPEMELDRRMTALRKAELAEYAVKESYPFEMNFREAHPAVLKSALYPILDSMPKGGMLHTHTLFDGIQLFQNATSLDTCWLNNGTGGASIPPGHYYFSRQEPSSTAGEFWVNLPEARAAAGDPTEFDAELFRELGFFTPELDSVSENQMWVMFDSPIFRQASLANYIQTYRWAFYHGLDMIAKGGLQHVEYRWAAGTLYDLDGSTTPEIDVALSVLKEYNNDHPSRPLTLKFIYEVNRGSSPATVLSDMKRAVLLRREYPDIAGFDLVDQEDRYGPLIEFLDEFLEIRNLTQTAGEPELPFFFHAGETNRHRGAYENMYLSLIHI